MEEKNVTVNELISGMVTELQRLGYTPVTVWNCYFPKMGQIGKYYREHGYTFYSLDVTADYVRRQEERFSSGEITENCYRKVSFTAKRMNEFFLTGTLRVNPEKRGTAYFLSEQNERLKDLFLGSRCYGEKAGHDAEWAVRRYLNHWEQKGYKTIGEATMDDVMDFIVETAAKVKPSSLYNILLYLKHFHQFLIAGGIPAPDCVELFSTRVYRSMPIQGYVTDEELGKILGVINTATEKGMRDRAIILLGASTGLRACDIIRLKLSDINWRTAEIRVEQTKTGQTVCVPLIRETAEAIRDYILKARPSGTNCQEVFLRSISPKTAIGDTMCISCMFKSYQEKAGIGRKPGDGKGFHGLRRGLAKKLLVEGVPLTTIAQILGHTDIRSSRQYLSLNTDNLKECALGFEGIPVERRGLA